MRERAGRHRGRWSSGREGRPSPARVIATAVARRRGGRIPSFLPRSARRRRRLIRPRSVTAAGALVTAARRVRHIPRAIAAARGPILERVGPVIPPRSPASVSGAMDRLEESDDEESAGQSHGGARPRGGSRLRCVPLGPRVCRPASSPEPSRRTTACRCRARRSPSNRPRMQGTLSAVTDVNGIYVVRGLPPGDYIVTIEMDGMATLKRPTPVQLGRTVTLDVAMAPAAVAEQVTVRGHGRAGRHQPDHRRQLQHRADQPAADRPHAVHHRRARARPDRQRHQRRPDHDRRRLRLRQRLPDQRRRRQRQHLRHQQQPVHRGRDRGDAGAHLGHLGRVRPLLGRRRQRRHQARRRHLLGQLSPQPEQRVVDRRDAVRDARAPGPLLERATKAPSAARCSAPRRGSSAPAATRTRPTARTFPQTGIGYDYGLDNKRYELKGTATPRANHTVTVGFTDNSTTQKNRPGLAASSIEPRTLVTRSAARTTCSSPTGTASSGRSCSPRRRSRRRSQGFRNTGGTSTEHHRLAVPHPRPERHPGQPALQRAVLRLDRSRGPQQPPGRRQPLDAAVVGQGRHARPEGRLRVVPLDQHRRQLADVDRLRLLLGLRQHRRRAGVRRPEPADSDVRAGHVAALQLAGDARREHRHQDDVALRCTIAGRSTAT